MMMSQAMLLDEVANDCLWKVTEPKCHVLEPRNSIDPQTAQTLIQTFGVLQLLMVHVRDHLLAQTTKEE